jgi:hypothetical protein
VNKGIKNLARFANGAKTRCMRPRGEVTHESAQSGDSAGTRRVRGRLPMRDGRAPRPNPRSPRPALTSISVSAGPAPAAHAAAWAATPSGPPLLLLPLLPPPAAEAAGLEGVLSGGGGGGGSAADDMMFRLRHRCSQRPGGRDGGGLGLGDCVAVG